jgi:hypothetical protein
MHRGRIYKVRVILDDIVVALRGRSLLFVSIIKYVMLILINYSALVAKIFENCVYSSLQFPPPEKVRSEAKVHITMWHIQSH